MHLQLTSRCYVRTQGLKTWKWCDVMKHHETVHLPIELSDRCIKNTYANCIGVGNTGVVLVGAHGPAPSPAPSSTSTEQFLHFLPAWCSPWRS